ncbi:MAG: 16S rRNA (cytidine(1402)-2'-O)-methyltransferase [Desulfobacteraceae bacterium]|nr:MAG: 16S rRNA (cytidine(1402)-2'-O)-methyltransferase [Desulfobacteraceae bacterium]
MPSTSPTNDAGLNAAPGTLYVVATPIGNRDDITLRALSVLKEADLIAAEDTRHTGKFLSLHNIKGHLISYHEYNERERTPGLVNRLKNGLSIALVSNAGTPVVSDPGYRLIKEAIAAGINIVPVPGVSAAVAAISVSGLATDSFIFIGFCPKKKEKRLDLLRDLHKEKRTVIFYESPRRILRLIEEIKSVMGERDSVLSREITKLHEEFIRGTLSEIITVLKQRSEIKGECTLLVSGFEEIEISSPDLVTKDLKASIHSNEKPLSVLAKETAKKFGLSRKRVYEEALRIKNEQS